MVVAVQYGEKEALLAYPRHPSWLLVVLSSFPLLSQALSPEHSNATCRQFSCNPNILKPNWSFRAWVPEGEKEQKTPIIDEGVSQLFF